MNRRTRRAAASKASAHSQIRVEDYRVGPGRVALTFDIAGHDPSTVSVDASSLSNVLARVEAAVAGRSPNWADTHVRCRLRRRETC